MEFDLLKLELDGAIATLTFNDPDNLNAMSEPMLNSLDKALDVIEDPENGVRCLIMTGAGRGFCAGANVANMNGNGAEDASRKSNAKPDVGAGLERIYHPLLRRLRNLRCPIVSAVNGPCAGVGMSFALMGDMIIAGKSAFFLQAFRRIGLVRMAARLFAAAHYRHGARPRIGDYGRPPAGRNGFGMGADKSCFRR